MSKVYSTNQGTLFSSEGNFQQDVDGYWHEAIPLPFYGLRKVCGCGKKFFKEADYRQHYFTYHTNGKKYERTPKGM